jgi:hypothetical protein
MSNGHDDEETTILATYTTRRDAEVAREYLDDAGIRAFVQSDDAGGMHPQMQRPNGVKLIGMSGSAQEARSLLETAGFLPDDGQRPAEDALSEEADDLTFSLNGTAGILGGMAVLLLLLLFLFG